MGMGKIERREQGQMTREAAEGKQRKAERNVCLGPCHPCLSLRGTASCQGIEPEILKQGFRHMLEMALHLREPLTSLLDFRFIPGNCSLMLATESWKWENISLCFQKASALSK